VILAVAGGKGGVGKSTVALNVAAELDAVLVDADLGMADLPGSSGPDLHDVLADRATVDEAVCDVGSLTMLPCGRSLAGARAADVGELRTALERLARRIGPAVVDCPAGLRSDVGVPLLAATACLLVTQPDEPALTAAVRVRELARALDAPLAGVVLNRTDDVAAESVASTLGAPVTQIPESTALARAQRAGVPVSHVDPDGRPARRFRELADRLQSLRSAT